MLTRWILIRNQFSRPGIDWQPAMKDQKEAPTHAAVWQAENEPVLDGGNPPRPIRHFRLAERRTPDRNSSQVPVHSALVQKSVATNTNLAGRLSVFDAREFRSDAQGVAPKKMAGRLLGKSPEGRRLGSEKQELTIPSWGRGSLPAPHPARARGVWRASRNPRGFPLSDVSPRGTRRRC